jgi:hypothetical protein
MPLDDQAELDPVERDAGRVFRPCARADRRSRVRDGYRRAAEALIMGRKSALPGDSADHILQAKVIRSRPPAGLPLDR